MPCGSDAATKIPVSQNGLFRILKQAVLSFKTACFTSPNGTYCNSTPILGKNITHTLRRCHSQQKFPQLPNGKQSLRLQHKKRKP